MGENDINNAEIFIINSDGSNETRVTSTPHVEGDPAWRPTR
jgi:Tol biopolymer transport system component